MAFKILVLHSGVELYGSDRSLLKNLEVIKRNSPDTIIEVVLHKDGPLSTPMRNTVDNLKIYNYGVLSRDDVAKGFLKAFWKVLKAAYKLKKKSKGYDLIYVNTLTVFSVYFLFPFLWRKKKVINVREIPIGVQRFVFSLLLKFTNAHLLFNSRSTQDAFLFISHIRKSVVYNHVDIFNSQNSNKFDNKPLKIAMIGRVYPLKGHHIAIKAMERLSTAGIDFKLKIVGGAAPGREAYLDEIKEQISLAGLEGSVDVLPFSSDVSEFYNWADIVLISSVIPESFGRTVVEGMGYGCLVVASNHGGPAELISNNNSGFLYSPGSDEELYEILRNVNSNSDLAKRVSSQGVSYFVNTFTEEKFSANLMKVLNTYCGVEVEK